MAVDLYTPDSNHHILFHYRVYYDYYYPFDDSTCGYTSRQ